MDDVPGPSSRLNDPPKLPGRAVPIHWRLLDPSVVTGKRPSWTVFRNLAPELDTRVGYLLAHIQVTTV